MVERLNGIEKVRGSTPLISTITKNRCGELLPREQMERAADSAHVSDEALVAILLKTGARGLNVVDLSRRLIELGHLADIPLKDHLVIGDPLYADGYISICATSDLEF